MADRQRWGDVEVGRSFQPVRYAISAQMVEEFEAAVGVSHPWCHGDSPYGFPIVPPTLPCTDYTRFLAQIFPPVVGMHARHRLKLVRPIPVGVEVVVSGRVVDKFIKRDHAYIVIEYQVDDAAGEPYVINTISTTIDGYIGAEGVEKELSSV